MLPGCWHCEIVSKSNTTGLIFILKQCSHENLLKSLGRENSSQYPGKHLPIQSSGYFVVSEDQKVTLTFFKVIIVHPKPTEKEAGMLYLVKYPNQPGMQI